MAVFKRGGIYWFKFTWRGDPIRETTKQNNKRVAEQIEAARRAALAKGEVGIRDRKPCPTLKEFADGRFLPHVRAQFASKRRTLVYYAHGVATLLAHPALAGARLEEIKPEMLSGFVSKQRDAGYKVSTTNRHLQVLRRMLKLAMEWGITDKALVKVRLQPGELRRSRVLTADEEQRYLAGARAVGDALIRAYEKALGGIRATQRGEQPIKPPDPYLLHDVGVILAECALRPEECYRLCWSEIVDGCLHIAHGKTDSARRVIPLSAKAAAVLEMRRAAGRSLEWVFPSATASGHVERCTLRDRHVQACKLAEIEHFVPYIFRHTCLTRWARSMDPYVLAYVAGHADFSTTRRYVHPQPDAVREAMERARSARTGHKIGHSDEIAESAASEKMPVIN
jgi:integrase